MESEGAEAGSSTPTYTKDDVDQLADIMAADDFCEKHGIDVGEIDTLEGLKALLMQKLKGRRASTFESPNVMKQIINDDRQKRLELSAVYLKLMSFVQKDLGEELNAGMEDVIPDFKDKLGTYNAELVNSDCPILVAGETSAGKSSLLNLILGEEVLPYCLLSSTSVICKLRNSEEKRAVVHLSHPDPVTKLDTKSFYLEKTDGKSIQDQLNEYVNAKDRETTQYRFVDIFWPIPLLQGNVFIVDSPGIGESPVMTKIVMDFLPKAFAFIYVINAAIAGGVQEDRLEKLLRAVTLAQTEGEQLQSFDPKSAIFVFNKWDQVPEKEEQTVKEKTFAKLKRCWEGLEESQVFYLSTLEASNYWKSGAGYTESFQKLLDGISDLVPRSLEMKLGKHHRWLEYALKRLSYNVRTRLINARKTVEQKEQKKIEIDSRLEVLQEKSDQIMEKMKNAMDEKVNAISKDLHEYLSSPEIVEHLNEWNMSELPDSDSMEVVEEQAQKLIHKVITDKIKSWEETHQRFKKAKDELRENFKGHLRLIDDELRKVEDNLQDESSSHGDNLSRRGSSGAVVDPMFSNTEKIVLGLTSPLWIPLALVASVIALPVIGGLAFHEKVKLDNKLQKYRANKIEWMKAWMKSTLDELNPKCLISMIEDSHLVHLKQFLHGLSSLIPRIIEADKHLIDDVLKDARSEKELVKYYNPKLQKCEELYGHLQLFRVRHMRKFELQSSDICQKTTCIGNGSFAKVYQATMLINGKKQEVALKVMKETLSPLSAADYLMEEETLKHLQPHPNILTFLGTIYEKKPHKNTDKKEPVEKLIMVTELCASTMKDVLLDNPANQPAHFINKDTKLKQAFAVVGRMAGELMAAVKHIHSKGYIHRDLKMENILVTADGTVKLADVGLTKHQAAITGTLCGTILYIAPEILAKMPYDSKADIHSLGLLLWEMWYGQKVFSNCGSVNSFDLWQMVLDGARPEFTVPDCLQPPQDWQTLMQGCWAPKPEDRPTAEECFQKITMTNSPSYIENLPTALREQRNLQMQGTKQQSSSF